MHTTVSQPWTLLLLALLAVACGGSTSSDGGSGGVAGDGGSADTCWYGGKQYAIGASFLAEDGCNTCSCSLEGVGCTLMACATGCHYNGQDYQPFESFVAKDGCNECTCEPTGEVSCTNMACTPDCVYGGKPYAVGEAFPSLDGCNQCHCAAPSVVSCTTSYCMCDPKSEWWRHYVATDLQTCAVIDFGCPDHTTGFENQCGCGCQQELSCPQWLDCTPPANCAELVKKCPYSGVALD